RKQAISIAGMFFFVLVLSEILHAVDFSSNLPILVIDTNGKRIVNSPRITARLGVIDNGPGRINHSSDAFTHYDGRIAIELRGSSGLWQKWPKEQYGFETQNPDGSNNNVPLLGLPPENDWILYPPYSDKSLIRNVLAYRLSRDIGRYAPRTRFCELVLNGDYRGVYVLIEKIKRDKNRVNIAKLLPEDNAGDALTGGYIVKIDRRAGEENEGWKSPFRYSDKGDIEWLYHDPDPYELTRTQKSYIRDYVTAFEKAMMQRDWQQNLDRFFDLEAFVDYYLLTELANNIDTYTFSTFFYKDRDSRSGRLTIGPIWDINLGFGNADYFVGMNTEGWLLGEKIRVRDRIPAWLKNIYESPQIQVKIARRWQELRRGPWAEERILGLIDAYVDTLAEAQQRNFQRWPILGQYVWPNAFIGKTYAEEIDYLKTWLIKRGRWMDGQLTRIDRQNQGGVLSVDVFPNPSNSRITIMLDLPQPAFLHATVYNIMGDPIARVFDGPAGAGQYVWQWSGENNFGTAVPSGCYFLILQTKGERIVRPFILLR
ncbi:MAG: CotH kinase family protein, partial [candidate division KSB1 bacterium]|nr:CotH kinase family protein [candidate division KSB1 bacterium]